jgi:ABC-type protease/lipase transport system fused ATPase/permease subunit
MAIAGTCEEAHATLWGGAAFVLGTEEARWQLMRWRLVRVVAVSGMLALLNLSTSLYLLAVYDYVLPRGSLAALGAITLLVCLLHVSFVALEQARARKICQVGVGFIEELDSQLLRVVASEKPASCVVLLEDVERVRRFLAGVARSRAYIGLSRRRVGALAYIHERVRKPPSAHRVVCVVTSFRS